MSRLALNRSQIAAIAQGVPQTISALETVFGDVAGFPSTIEEANALAGQALAAAQLSLSMLAVLADALAQLEGAPVATPYVEADDHTPRAHAGTVSTQNHDSIEITGGTIDNTPIGATTAAAGKFATLAASGQITSTVAAGTPPLVVASDTLVETLYVAHAANADEAAHALTANYATDAGAADHLTSPSSFPAAATDLPTAITLANALRAAAISKGL